MNTDIVILTDSRYINPTAPGSYVQNVLTEDQIVKEALESKGLIVDRKDWADPDFDWTTTTSVLFRTTWDYFNRYEEFSNWLANTSLKTRFINSKELISWNIDKHYLDDLAQQGVRVVPTRYLNRASSLSIHRIHEITGWTDTVVKPTVGGAARHTYRVQPESINMVASKLDGIMRNEDFMIQPFQQSVMSNGEWSFVFFGTTFSHAILKKAKNGDFRVQDDFGGSIHDYHPHESEIQFALSAILACPEIPSYSRVDILLDNDGSLAVSELELIEPELWFRKNPVAAQLLADEVINKLS